MGTDIFVDFTLGETLPLNSILRRSQWTDCCLLVRQSYKREQLQQKGILG
ncbi:uncharacterized protein PHALS_08340 [Plasmopara halstedii]|uniref:Uncharacterized protein n=1 Tax=Plasmopara halstedii TaxID=4781 RepID=A0A0P1ABG6_PLAHL|nr:uncharacterized protein PHALS_08340 [Plasmopara halstedii]CEG38255.1 hypothetical protein PHALS_08340 [Plasmopara halstedii]|eukprot:XP_024574624.1 hypothetical protein PHALS_08340 [Plasmopara halstedii]